MSIPLLIHNLPRTMTREKWAYLWQTMRKVGEADILREPGHLEWRQAKAAEIAEKSVGGVMWVYEWGRDCDMCEADSVRGYPASVLRFEQKLNDMHQSAEGPCSMSVITAEDAAEYEPYFRDRVMEAFEDGRGANAYSV